MKGKKIVTLDKEIEFFGGDYIIIGDTDSVDIVKNKEIYTLDLKCSIVEVKKLFVKNPYVLRFSEHYLVGEDDIYDTYSDAEKNKGDGKIKVVLTFTLLD